MDFYQVLALFKLSVIAEGILKRMKLGKTLGPGFDDSERSSEIIARRALTVADASADPRLH